MMYVMHDSERYGYLQENGGPMPPDRVARRCGGTQAEYDALYLELETAAVPSRTADGIIYSRRMVRDDAKRKKERKRQQNHRDKPESCHARVTPSVTPLSQPLSVSSSSSISKKETDTEGFARRTFKRFWGDYPEHRRIGRDLCFQLWLMIGSLAQDQAVESLPFWLRAEVWAETRFIPSAENFIRKRMWETKPSGGKHSVTKTAVERLRTEIVNSGVDRQT